MNDRTVSAVPPPRRPPTGSPLWLKAMLATGALIAAMAVLVAAVGLADSPDYSAASGGGWGADSSGPSSTPGASSGSTPTLSAPPVVILATNTPIPTETPEPTATPMPTRTPQPRCPETVTRDTYCFEPYPTSTPEPTATPKPEPTPRLCTAVEGGMCWKVPDATPSRRSAGT